MPSIEDFLHPLHEGIWEVSIPRDQVTEPFGEEWVRSQINVPTPGTMASYRSGQYHLHETRTEFKVHLDRYDPKRHPLLHLIDDAPLLLMISETFITLISFTRQQPRPGTGGQIDEQNAVLRHHLILGPLLIFLGVIFIIIPDLTFFGLTTLLIPGVVLLFGVLTLMSSVSIHPFRVSSRNDLIGGVWIIGVAVILGWIPPRLWGGVILVLLSGWMFASSVMLLRRVLRGRRAVPEGFVSRMLIGAVSLLLGGASLIAPEAVLMIFMDILGVLTVTAGGVVTITGIRLRRMMQPE
nr:hypothetical protein [uncultured Methanospirillum sp.]